MSINDLSPFTWDKWLTEIENNLITPAYGESVKELIAAIKAFAKEQNNGEISVSESEFDRALKNIDSSVDHGLLKSFDLDEIFSWKLSTNSVDEFISITLMLFVLHKDVLKFKQLSEYYPTDWNEKRENRMQLGVIESRIQEFKNTIKDILLGTRTEQKISEQFSLGYDNHTEADEKKISLSYTEAPLTLYDASKPSITSLDAYDNVNAYPRELGISSNKNASNSEDVFKKILPVSSKDVDNFLDSLDPEANSIPYNGLIHLKGYPEIYSSLTVTRPRNDPKDFIWALIALDDIPAAYLLTKSIEKNNLGVYIPSWLLAAVQGSRWLRLSSDRFVSDILGVTKEQNLGEEESILMLGLAAALGTMPVNPFCGLNGWLRSPQCCDELKGLVGIVEKFSALGVTVYKEDIAGLLSEEQSKNLLIEITQRAKNWLIESPKKRTRFSRATEVHRYLVSKDGDLYNLILPVSKNDKSQLEKTVEMLKLWQDQTYVVDQIHRIDKRIFGNRDPIVSDPLSQLLREINNVCVIVADWCRLYDRQSEANQMGNWKTRNISDFRSDLANEIPIAYKALNDLVRSTQQVEIVSASLALQRVILQLNDTFRVGYIPEISYIQNSWEWFSTSSYNLYEALDHRLLFFPELEINDNIQILQTSFDSIGKSIRNSTIHQRGVVSAILGWIFKEDYRFIGQLLEWLNDNSQRSKMQQEYKTALENSISTLTTAQKDVEYLIEQYVVDGIIAEERAELNALVVGSEPINVQNFTLQYNKLKQVKDKLIKTKQERLEKITFEWGSLKDSIINGPNDTRTKLIPLVDKAIEQSDTRLAEEYISRLSQSVVLNETELESLLADSKKEDKLVEYIGETINIWKWLKGGISLDQIARDVREGRRRLMFQVADMPSGPRREEVYRAILAWQQLKQNSAVTLETRLHIRTLLQYLGFSFDPKELEPVKIIERGNDRLYASVKMSAGDQARPIWQFGSYTNGEYSVVCLWERPGADMISAQLKDLRLELKSVILLYLGRLTAKQQLDLVMVSENQELTVAILDEILLIYLASEYVSRLPAFLKSSLPFTSLNPYTPFKAGNLPSEMFFGRLAMARELQLDKGSCIVYGGRQLGKSALLRFVKNEFVNPSQEHYAEVIDIKMLGNPMGNQPIDIIWRKLRDTFKEFKLIPERITTDNPDEIERHIRQAFKEDNDRRVLILLDEADNFLDADSKFDFKITEQFRTLMVDTKGRFKIVLAGLHNVQRFYSLPNQPLAHFGTPICVGPLEPDAAMDLVVRPLEYLGYRFADQTGPLLIMSYTNYHPGLIQLFCDELLKQLRSRKKKGLPPYKISKDDIESVYRTVRDRIKERFEWTLALDSAYQAIAWSLIVDQMHLRDGYSQAYSHKEIYDLARSNWKEGFERIGLVEFRGLLDEMVGLGVLATTGTSQFRLRSPNLVRLMGNDTTIESQLIELINKEPNIVPDVNYYHSLIPSSGDLYSPFNYDQERAINQPKFNVGLVFASKALGLELILDSLKNLMNMRSGSNDSVVEELPLWVTTADEMLTMLDLYLSKYKKREHILISYTVEDIPVDSLIEIIKTALEFCQKHKSSRRTLKVIFIFDPSAALRWFSVPVDIRSRIEDEVDAVLCPRKWNVIGIKQRLAQRDQMYTDKICDAILFATNGWPILLNALFQMSDRKDNPQEAAKAIAEQLTRTDAEVFAAFKHELNFTHDPLIKQIIDLLSLEDRPIPRELIIPEFFDVQSTIEEIDTAMQFLVRMGIIEERQENVSIDPVVKKLYAQTS